MDFRQLEVFIAVVELSSFSKAGEQLYLSQPTVSAHISALEKELAVPLLIRNTREVYTSEAGQQLYDLSLIHIFEGKRGMPRVKPPRTVEHGLFDKPTVLNNVETYANVPLIINKGAAWYKTIGPENSPGTKAFALTGNIVNTGLIEVPMGTTLREIIFEIGGGMRDGGEFKAVQIGGPSGGCLTKDDLDLPLDFDSLTKAGAMIGSGGLVVMDDKTCMVEVARFFMNFTQNESCGKCVPCREGTKRMLAILERIVNGEGEDGDIEMLLELALSLIHISATAA